MKIAALVPVYNAETYLRECLDSILAQTFPDVTVFCCDDGSKDGSRKILEDYAAKTSRVRFVTQENRGVAAARNRLMDELPPEFEAFAFVDSDDFIAPGMYAKLAEAMERTGADVAESGWTGEERVIDDMSVFHLRRTSPGAWINVINKLYRRRAVGGIRFRLGLAFEEDFFFNREVNAAIRRKVLVNGDFYTYRDNPASATHVLNQRRYLASTAERIRLSCEVFLAAGRIPADVETSYRAELSKDAYRMCIRKNLKRNRNARERRELFARAGGHLAAWERDFGFVPVGLNPVQRLIWSCCRRGRYALARLLVFLT